jgi:hypothetical protein
MFNRVTWREFKVCAHAIFGFAVGYKCGEKYRLGAILEKPGKKSDYDAWQLGYDLATKRSPYQCK